MEAQLNRPRSSSQNKRVLNPCTRIRLLPGQVLGQRVAQATLSFAVSSDPVKNRSQIQLRFEGTEDGCDLGELNVLAPEFFGITIR